MRRKIKKILQLAAGWLLLLLGVVGLFLPVLQGILFIMLGLLVLSYHSPWAERLLARLRARFPRQHAAMHEWAHRLRSRFSLLRRRHPAAEGCQGGCERKPGSGSD